MVHPSRELIQDALREATGTRQVVIGTGALAMVAVVFKQTFGAQSTVVIADENTFANLFAPGGFWLVP